MAISDAATRRYWRTEVSDITPQAVHIRGYNLEDLIGVPFATTAFLLMKGRVPSPAEARVFDALLTSVLDYGLEKAGTAAARYVVSGNPNMQAGLAAATLSAGANGLATEDSARFVRDTHSAYLAAGEPDMADFARQVVADAQREKVRIPGFGHPVFRDVDPRAKILKDIAVDAGLWAAPAALYEAVHREFIRQPGREHFPINDVGIMGAIAVAMGFTPEESTAITVIGTLPGVAAHISEEFAARQPGRVIPPAEVDYARTRRDLRDDLEYAGWTQVGGGRTVTAPICNDFDQRQAH